MENRLIFDLGMHKGEDAEFYLKKGFDVIAIEADPDLAGDGARRLSKYLKSGQLKIINKAIALSNEKITFYKCVNVSAWGTSNKDWAERVNMLGGKITEIPVDGIAFSQLLRDYGVPYYMKVDIEGADLICLRQLLSTSERPKFISIESSKSDIGELIMEFSLFEQLGYKNFKVIPQHRIGEQKLPNPAREGVFVEHTFRLGSSGSFGQELPGLWLTLEQALKVYLGIYRFNRITGNASALPIGELARRISDKKSSNTGAVFRSTARKITRNIGTALGLRPGWYDTHAMYPEPEGR